MSGTIATSALLQVAHSHSGTPSGVLDLDLHPELTMKLRSVKYEGHAGGWCSDTEAIMGMYLDAYVGSSRLRDRPSQSNLKLSTLSKSKLLAQQSLISKVFKCPSVRQSSTCSAAYGL